MTKRSRIAAFGSAGVLVLAGVVAAVVVAGTAGQLVAFGLIAIGFVLATSLIFFEVGLSEDRERSRHRGAPPEGEERHPRMRLGRMRGGRRRLS